MANPVKVTSKSNKSEFSFIILKKQKFMKVILDSSRSHLVQPCVQRLSLLERGVKVEALLFGTRSEVLRQEFRDQKMRTPRNSTSTTDSRSYPLNFFQRASCLLPVSVDFLVASSHLLS